MPSSFKPAIADKGKWAAKTSFLVQELCNKAEGIPIGIALCFFDPFKSECEFVYRLNYDPNNPPTEEQRNKLLSAFQYMMRCTAALMAAETLDKAEEIVKSISIH